MRSTTPSKAKFLTALLWPPGGSSSQITKSSKAVKWNDQLIVTAPDIIETRNECSGCIPVTEIRVASRLIKVQVDIVQHSSQRKWHSTLAAIKN